LFLLIGGSFMLFPMLWMLSASLKPPWQIFTDPPIWIPQEWETVRAGSTNRELLLYRIEQDGTTENVIQIGSRRYTVVIPADANLSLTSAPTAELTDAVAQEIDGQVFNVRTWTPANSESVDVVALARGEGDTLVVAPLAELQTAAMRLPLDVVNGGSRENIALGEVEFRGREIEINGQATAVIPIGPESDLSVVGAPEIAQSARLVQSDALTSAGEAVVGQTELMLNRIEGDETDYIVIARDAWHPVIDEAQLDEAAIVASADQLGERTTGRVNGINVQVAPYTAEEGTEATEVVILVSGTARSLVIPSQAATTLRLAEFGGLTSARGDVTDRIPYRVQDGFDEGETISSVALVGEPREMSLIVPSDAVSEAFDVAPAQLDRALHTELRFDGYRDALQTKVGDTYFPTFFRNSFVLVALNAIGHLFSCVIVAYAFARLRAPGKNFLFLILLSTMMLPFPVTLVPMYEIFRDLGMINTLYPLFLRSFFGNAFLIFMLRQFFASIPRELEEAARIDGANVLQIIWMIFVPLSKAALMTVVIFTFWWTWNSFLEPLIYLNSPDLYPVSLGLNFFKDQYGAIYYDRMIAASVLSMLPLLLLFFFAQRYFIEGIQTTGLKG
jgi:ABC-type glycerol-3-phosphate transport system permease component